MDCPLGRRFESAHHQAMARHSYADGDAARLIRPAASNALLPPLADREHSSRSRAGVESRAGDQLANALRRSAAPASVAALHAATSPRTMAVHRPPPICFTPTSFTRALLPSHLRPQSAQILSPGFQSIRLHRVFSQSRTDRPFNQCVSRVRTTSVWRGTAATNASFR